MWNFNIRVRLCSLAGWAEPYLVANPEASFLATSSIYEGLDGGGGAQPIIHFHWLIEAELNFPLLSTRPIHFGLKGC